MGKNIVQEKSFELSVQAYRIISEIRKTKKEYLITKQLLRSSTSIGANIEEAIGGSSRKDFLNKMRISYKEARETRYWLKLMMKVDLIGTDQYDKLFQLNQELLKLLGSIISSTKKTIKA